MDYIDNELVDEEREKNWKEIQEVLKEMCPDPCPICGFALERSGNCRRCGYCERC